MSYPPTPGNAVNPDEGLTSLLQESVDDIGLADDDEKLTYFQGEYEDGQAPAYSGTQTTLEWGDVKDARQLRDAATTYYSGNEAGVNQIRELLFKAGMYADSANELKKDGEIHHQSFPPLALDAWDMKALENAQRLMTDAGYPGFVWDSIPTGDGSVGGSFLDVLGESAGNSSYAKGVAEIEFGPLMAELELWADRNGQMFGRDYLAERATEIMEGTMDKDDLYKYWTETYLVPEYGSWATPLQASLGGEEGNRVDAYALANPYITKAEALLELPAGSMNLNDGLIHDAMAYTNDKGEPVRMGMTEFEDRVKSDDRWEYTNNAHEEIGNKMSWFDDLFGI